MHVLLAEYYTEKCKCTFHDNLLSTRFSRMKSQEKTLRKWMRTDEALLTHLQHHYVKLRSSPNSSTPPPSSVNPTREIFHNRVPELLHCFISSPSTPPVPAPPYHSRLGIIMALSMRNCQSRLTSASLKSRKPHVRYVQKRPDD